MVIDDSDASDMLLVYILAPLGAVCLIMLVIVTTLHLKRRSSKNQQEQHLATCSISAHGGSVDKQLSTMMVPNPFYDRYTRKYSAGQVLCDVTLLCFTV